MRANPVKEGLSNKVKEALEFRKGNINWEK